MFGERGAERGDGRRIGLLGGAVLELHLALFLDVEAQVFEQHDLAGGQLGGGGLDGGADAVVEELHRLAEQLGQLVRDGLERELVAALAVGAAEVRHEDHGRALLEGVLDGRQGGGDARGVGDSAGLLVLRDVEIDAHEHAFARQGEVADGFKFGHGEKKD